MSDAEANFDDWYSREYSRVLAAVAFACDGMSPGVEDATNEAFLRALERWHRVGQMNNPTAWVTKVAINQSRRWFRRTAIERAGAKRTTLLSYVDATDNVTHADLLDALSQLTHRQRRVIVLRYVSDMTQQDVATELQVAPGTIASTLHQARSRLKEDLLRRPGESD